MASCGRLQVRWGRLVWGVVSNPVRVMCAASALIPSLWLPGSVAHVIIACMQLELFPFDCLTAEDLKRIHVTVRNAYWHIRNLRGGHFGQARLRRCYRLVEVEKKRLLLAGVSKREILDLLRCCRLQCTRHKQPFDPCSFCP